MCERGRLSRSVISLHLRDELMTAAPVGILERPTGAGLYESIDDMKKRTKEIKIGKCRLCGKVAKLCKSHIIPDFLYKPLLNEQGKLEYSRLWDDTLPEPEYRTMKFLPTGWYERLLCAECERLLGLWETYARDVLRGEGAVKIAATKDRVILYDVDYQKFKLFQMSILWRASISQRPEFVAVDLKENEEVLRQMIAAQNPGRKEEFGCSLILLDGKDSLRIHPPSRVNNPEIEAYYFVMGGFLWNYPVGPQSLDDFLLERMISPDGVLILSKIHYSDFLNAFGVRGTGVANQPPIES
jgi:hypothetical protein